MRQQHERKTRSNGRRDAVQNAPDADERAMSFLRLNPRPPKPRTRGITEIRGPYYSSYGTRHLEDVFETMGHWVDALKFAGGSFALMPRGVVKRMIELCHANDVIVSTGG